jgi:(R,R)-butanediol dehydrogenase / meso-butanediol dehydrogenase / diacetyl reductase
MRVARFHNKGDIRVEDIDEPKAGDGKFVIDVEWCGICGTSFSCKKNRWLSYAD